MTYDFSVEQLHKMNLVHEDKGPRGVVQRYRSQHCIRSYQSDPFVLVL